MLALTGIDVSRTQVCDAGVDEAVATAGYSDSQRK